LFSANDNGDVSGFSNEFNLAAEVDNLLIDQFRAGLVNHKYFHLLVQQFTAEADVDGRFNFVAREDPQFDSCFLYLFNHFRYFILELVFDSRGSDYSEVCLDFLSNCEDDSISVDDRAKGRLVLFVPGRILLF